MVKFPLTIAPEGVRWFSGLIAVSAILLLFSGVAGGIAAILAIGAALFFRVPRRNPPQGTGLILSPADGKVVEIQEVAEGQFLKDRCNRISIFLSIFDVHMNYAPAGGTIEWIDYKKGNFHWAFEPKASESNENQRIGISTPAGKILVRQIAGTVARRLVLSKKILDKVSQGEIIGMIKFGSRVEIYLPRQFPIRVKRGDRVAGGLTVLAEVRP